MFLFLYINDLPIKEAKVILFANGRIILVIAENGQILQQKLNRVMNDFHLWFCADSLIANTEKRTAVSFDSRQERYPVNLQTQFGSMNIA